MPRLIPINTFDEDWFFILYIRYLTVKKDTHKEDPCIFTNTWRLVFFRTRISIGSSFYFASAIVTFGAGSIIAGGILAGLIVILAYLYKHPREEVKLNNKQRLSVQRL